MIYSIAQSVRPFLSYQMTDRQHPTALYKGVKGWPGKIVTDEQREGGKRQDVGASCASYTLHRISMKK